MSSNIIGLFPKKPATPSEKVEKQVGIWMIPKSQWSQSVESIFIIINKRRIPGNITSKGDLQDQRDSSILIMSGYKKSFLHVNHISIQNFLVLILKVKRWKHIKYL